MELTQITSREGITFTEGASGKAFRVSGTLSKFL